LVYYFVAVHSQHHAYNWIALLVLECILVIFWLVVWALIAALAAYVAYYNSLKRDLSKRYTYAEAEAYGAIFYALLAFGLIEWYVPVVSYIH
jgi:uncharacterized membrane protein